MSAFVDVETAHRFARTIEDNEARRLGISVGAARDRVANRIGVSPGTLENLRKLRSKIIPHWLMERIRAEFIAVLNEEIGRIEHEISLARQTGMDHRDHDLAAAETQLFSARALLKGR